MKKPVFFSTLILSLVLAAPFAQADKPGTKDKPEKAKQHEMRQHVNDESEAAMDRAEHEREAAEKREEAAREEAEEMAERKPEMSDDLNDKQSEERLGGAENAASRGSEKSQEMRDRRDQRKQIMDEHREGAPAAADGVDPDADSEQQAEEKKAKKPWWKFWGD